MELSRQELPLTVYFTKARAQKKSVDHSSPKRKLSATEEPSNGVPSKRPTIQAFKGGQSASRDTPAQPTVSESARPVRVCVNHTHLPTPATSARRRGLPALPLPEDASPKPLRSRLTTAGKSAARKQPVVLCEIDLTQSDSENIPSEVLARTSDLGLEPARNSSGVHSSSPSPSQNKDRCTRRTTLNAHANLPTPTQTARKALAPVPTSVSPESSPTTFHTHVHKFSLACARTLSPKRLQGKFSATKPLLLDNADPHSTSKGLGMSHQNDDNNPFCAPVFKFLSVTNGEQQEFCPADPLADSFTLTTPRSETPINVPPRLVPSSQSQYFLPLEATPKHKRNVCLDDVVLCSQSEESELCIATPARRKQEGVTRTPVGKELVEGHVIFASLDTCSSPSLSHELSLVCTPSRVCPRPVRWKGPSVHKSGSGPVSHPTTPTNGSPGVFHNSPSTRKQASSYRLRANPCSSPPRSLVRQNSMDIIPADLGDESATEPESDTDILHCVAAIGQSRGKRLAMSSSRHSSLRPLASPLLSPTARRERSEAPASCTLEGLVEDGEGLSVPGTHASPGFNRRRLSGRSESFPSVARNFMDMFQGDESYPEDFPESLRI